MAQNWNALQSIVLLAQTDKDSAMKNVQLLTASDVIRRFGSPTSVTDNTGRMVFHYYQVGPGNELLPGKVRFGFRDGLVTQIFTDRH